jgi:hypothetical protein
MNKPILRMKPLALASGHGRYMWLGWPHLTPKMQSKKPRPSTPPFESVLAAGKMSS